MAKRNNNQKELEKSKFESQSHLTFLIFLIGLLITSSFYTIQAKEEIKTNAIYAYVLNIFNWLLMVIVLYVTYMTMKKYRSTIKLFNK